MVAANNDCVAEHGLYGTHLDISDKLRTKIWEGKDVSLAELLMPKYEFQSAKSNITISLKTRIKDYTNNSQLRNSSLLLGNIKELSAKTEYTLSKAANQIAAT